MGLDPNSIPHMNIVKGYISVPGGTTSSSNCASALVIEEVGKEVMCGLKKVGDCVSSRDGTDC